MEVKVSIIVPIYKVEKYLQTCVESILHQTLHQIEVILVDDGSPDNCGRIADSYAAADSRVKVIHQENAGLGPARNTGIRIATGEYVGFVDSDDWVLPDMFRKLYDTAVETDADIVVSGHRDMAYRNILIQKKHPLAGTILQSPDEIEQTRIRLYGHAPQDSEVEVFPVSVCMSIYRRTLLEEKELRFLNILSEDVLFNLGAYRYAQRMAFTDGTDYCYRKEAQASITQSFSKEKIVKYQVFLETLRASAEREAEDSCVLRAQRAAIDFCRMFVGIVDAAQEYCLKDKISHIRAFAENQSICACWDQYPIKTLPIQQYLFHFMILRKWYLLALLLSRLRQILKKGANIQCRHEEASKGSSSVCGKN